MLVDREDKKTQLLFGPSAVALNRGQDESAAALSGPWAASPCQPLLH